MQKTLMSKTQYLKSRLSICFLGFFLVFNANLGWAKEPGLRDHITREDAVHIAKQGRDIKVLKVEKVKTASGLKYHVKLLTKNGRVSRVGIDAVTGAILAK